MNNLFRVDARPDGSCVVSGPDGAYVHVPDARVADAFHRCCERAYQRGAADTVAAGDTVAGVAAIVTVDELPAAVAALTCRRMGLRKAEAVNLLQRVRAARPGLRAAADLVRAALLVRSGGALDAA